MDSKINTQYSNQSSKNLFFNSRFPQPVQIFNLEDSDTQIKPKQQSQINDYLKVITNVKQLKAKKWDTDSPRFQMACHNLGIDPKTELQIKNLEEFDSGSVEKEIVEMRYKHHLKRVKNSLNQIIAQRQKIKGNQINSLTKPILEMQNEYTTDVRSQYNSSKIESPSIKMFKRQEKGLLKNPSYIQLVAGVNNKSNRNIGMSRATSHALLPSNRSQLNLPLNTINLKNQIISKYEISRQQNSTTFDLTSVPYEASRQNITILNQSSQSQQPTNLINPNTIFRDLKVKLIRQKQSEEIFKKHQEKLKKTKENQDYIVQLQDVKKKKQEEKREKHNQRYQKILQQQEDRAVQEYRKQIKESRNLQSNSFKTYSNNNPTENKKLNHSTLSASNKMTDFEKFQISYQLQQQRIQQILDNSNEMRKLQSIESKIMRSAQNYETEISLRKQKLHERNRTQEDRFRQVSEQKRIQEDEIFIKVQSNLLQQEQKVKERQKEIQEIQEQKNQQKSEQLLKMISNKKKEEKQSKSKLNSLLQRFDRAEQHRQEIRQNVEYQIKLKQEKRKLKEDDSQVLQERQKRQRQNQKILILLKQNEHEQNILVKQAQDEELRKIKKDLEMKLSIEKQKIRNNLLDNNQLTKSISKIQEIESILPKILKREGYSPDLRSNQL